MDTKRGRPEVYADWVLRPNDAQVTRVAAPVTDSDGGACFRGWAPQARLQAATFLLADATFLLVFAATLDKWEGK